MVMPPRPHEVPRLYEKRLGFIARNLVIYDRYVGGGEPLTDKGVVVDFVMPNSPASRGRLSQGDLVTSVGGKTVPDVSTLKSVLAGLAAAKAKETTVIVKRQGRVQGLSLKLQ